ncbi:MAG: UvrD-helicase domain-containing protein [Lachnospiraceae bacterium]|nr:UvrD-helicase domain-containing protein [Lachnospiraceae bacterium]
MGKNWTQEQSSVIESRGSSLLVSAAAGSGKTAVLAERILQLVMDPKDPLDVDHLLVVTFTKAAAGEMRERIRRVLEQSLEQDPHNEHLQRQCALINQASIMTIDSFCLDVIRTHFSQIDLEPGFRVGDPGEMELLGQDVLEKMLEQEYEEATEGFRLAADMLSNGRSDRELDNAILRFFRFSMAYPWPAEWREACLLPYRCETPRELEEQSWMKELLRRTGSRVRDLQSMLRQAIELCRTEGGPYMYEKTLEKEVEGLTLPGEDLSFTQMRLFLLGAEGGFGRLSPCRDKSVDPELKNQTTELRSEVKKQLGKLIAQFYRQDLETVLDILHRTAPLMEELVRLTGKYEESFAAEKRRRGLVDFADIEHMALQILIDRSEGADRPSPVAREYAENFACIMTDEYQDSNLVQELLLSSISGEEDGRFNRFMVGDVKQSIYRFRLARPEVFMEKDAQYASDGQAHRRIGLTRNFRSRLEVLEAVNTVFAQIMLSDVGGVEYDREARLNPGAFFPEEKDGTDYTPEIWLVAPELEETEGAGEAENGQLELPANCVNESAEKTEQEAVAEAPRQLETDAAVIRSQETPEELRGLEEEAALVARRIREMVGKERIYDRASESYRPVRFGDIAILLRSVRGAGDMFLDILSRAGIPAFTGIGEGYFDALEVRTVLAWLSVVDNPHQDTPLAAALLSPAGQLSAAQLAGVRLVGRELPLYEACRFYLEDELAEPETAAKLRVFFERIDQLRAMAVYLPIHELIWQLLDLTGYSRYVQAMPGGQRREANLQMLVEKAIAFENGSYRGLFHFLRYIEQLRKYEIEYAEASVTGEDEDAVRIMTIHKSKGLEFPVVFVSGLGKGFNQMDRREFVLLHPVLGAAPRLIDTEKHLRLPVLHREVLASRSQEEELGEELRVLYVAMTRACEKLILTGRCADPGKAVYGWNTRVRRGDGRLSYSARMDAGCFLDLLMPAALQHDSAVSFLSRFGLERSCPEAAGEGPGFCFGLASARELGQWLQAQSAAVPGDHPEEEALDTGQIRQLCRELMASLQADPEGKARELLLAQIPAKLSVSDLKMEAIHADEDVQRLYGNAEDGTQPEDGAGQQPPEEWQKPIGGETKPPATEEKNGGTDEKGRLQLSGAERGTIWHRVMELMDFTAMDEPDFVEKQLESMIKCGKISRLQSRVVKKAGLQRFFDSELARRMGLAAGQGKLYRETPFVISLPAREIHAEWDVDETVLIQGVIDAWFEEDDGIVLVDYKTDRIGEDGPEGLLKKYRVQIDLYQKALETLGRGRVKERSLYSFSLGETLTYPPDVEESDRAAD